MLRRAVAAALLFVAVAVPAARAGNGPTDCSWPMFGQNERRLFATPAGCTSVALTTAPTLRPKWYVPMPDEVSASPAVVDGHVFVGDWAGNFYSLSAATGAIEWKYTIDDTSSVGFGRIVSSAAYTVVGGRKVVVFGGGATLYVLDATSGARVASQCLDPRADVARCHTPGDQVEIESSPAIVRSGDAATVVVGLDVHNSDHVGRTGIVALTLSADASTVQLVPQWKFDPEAPDGKAYDGPDMLTVGSRTGSGCSDVWGSPTIDVAAGRVFFGTGSCSDSAAAAAYGEHVFAVSLATGDRLWSFRAHLDDATGLVDDDFGGAPNLLPNGLVGAGSKDGSYYALDPATGAVAWQVQVGQPGHATPGFAVGGILASTAVGKVNGRDAIFIATAISTPNDKPISSGPDTKVPSVVADPGRMLSLHAIDVANGSLLWRSPAARQAYGPPTYANGVVLVPSTFDFQLDAFDANTGLLLVARPFAGPPSSSPVAIGDSVYGGVGTSTGVGSPLAPLGAVYALQVALP